MAERKLIAAHLFQSRPDDYDPGIDGMRGRSLICSLFSFKINTLDTHTHTHALHRLMKESLPREDADTPPHGTEPKACWERKVSLRPGAWLIELIKESVGPRCGGRRFSHVTCRLVAVTVASLRGR